MTAGELPPFRVLASALRRTTERLAVEIQAPSAHAPEWSELDWRIAASAATMQGTSMLLARRLRWRGPEPWRRFLDSQLEQSRRRDARIAALLARIDTACREAGVPAVALKGAALRAFDLYSAGERPMGDIDLLVAPDDLARMPDVLARLGYSRTYVKLRHDVYEAGGAAVVALAEHADNPIRIEVHTHIDEALPFDAVEITARLAPLTLRPGINPYRDAAALLLHLLLHAAGNMRAHALRQIQLHDIAQLSRRLPPSVWTALATNPSSSGGHWWMFPVADLTERYYPGAIAADTLAALRTACPAALRLASRRHSLARVSWSNLRIHALPGLGFARSLPEAVRYVRSRLMPQRQVLDELANAERSMPTLQQVNWYGLSHKRRIARWLLGRPPRVQTMVSVRAALDAGGAHEAVAAPGDALPPAVTP